MRCHYDVLGIALDATVDDIKKAYRKCALQWHPDKHAENKEEANKRFLEIQEAYETLSSDQERAWYDSHREVLINGGTPGESNAETYLFNIYPFFSPTCYRGFGDDEKGFYTVYRDMFVNLAEEDRQFYEEKIEIPEFGKSDSDYDQIVSPFYSFWLSYCTPRSFVWVEKHDTREAGDRYVRRIMEKENKKARDKAKKERNEEIRKLVEHVRKRDKRVEQYKKMLEEKAQLNQKKLQEKKELERQKRIEQMKTYAEPDWSAVDRQLEELELSEKRKSKRTPTKVVKEDADGSDQEEDNLENENQAEEDYDSEFDESLYCVACDKSFQSAKSFQNHEKSKKHRDNIDLLRKHMKDEDMNLFQEDNNQSEDETESKPNNVNETKSRLSKKQKKKRKQNKQEIEESEPEPEPELEPEVKIEEPPNAVVDEETNKTSTENFVPEPAKPVVCSVCQEEFDTRNKLFEHIKKEGHAALKDQSDPNKPMSHNQAKKNKRLAKGKK